VGESARKVGKSIVKERGRGEVKERREEERNGLEKRK
jgi:hypothetical protein